MVLRNVFQLSQAPLYKLQIWNFLEVSELRAPAVHIHKYLKINRRFLTLVRNGLSMSIMLSHVTESYPPHTPGVI